MKSTEVIRMLQAVRSGNARTIVATLLWVVLGTGAGSRAEAAPPTCQLGNGIQHVINIVFDNVHFFRDNPNVPSDLEQMPTLLAFLESNGTVFSNSHTPMIAHTADDSLTIYTGLYGDRHGQPVTNSYNTYNADGSTDTATSFAYWTSPVADTKSIPTAGHDATPTMSYSPTVPAKGPAGAATPAPWVPFTRAGCSVGDFSTANMVLENTNPDMTTVFGANSPEVQQLNADPDRFKDPEVADYIGVVVHCAKNDSICANAQAVKFGQTSPSPSARPDLLPTEPLGYSGFQGLFGARYVAPVLGAGSPNKTINGFQVTNAAGNLVDLDGVQINNAFVPLPGFPGFSPTAAQTLAYLADMQEAGVPVTYGYISDTHDKKSGATGCTSPGNALGPGDACYVAALKSYDNAFKTFFERLAADGITPANTLFVISAEENDQFAGANVGRAIQPTPANCDGVTIACHYAVGQDGELAANIKGLLSTTASATAQYDVDAQGASIYVHGRPAANDATVRQLQRDTAAMSANNPYSGVNNEQIAQYQAGAVEQRILHMQTNDPLRTPTYSIFPVPDYFFGTSGPNVTINSGFAYDHGYYSPNIDVTWVAMTGPGVAVKGVDGPGPTGGNESQDPNSTNTVPEVSTRGTWVEEASIRPTMLYLAGLKDDYQPDGHVITQALAFLPPALQATEDLAEGYDQINSSVGQLATDTLLGDTKALASGSSADDSAFAAEQETLAQLADDRDAAAAKIKQTLSDAAAGHMPNHGEITSGLAHVKELLNRASKLAGN
jgi:hypothetical protein